MQRTALTDRQVDALRFYSEIYGRKWKSELLRQWQNGTCDNPDLQQVRNLFGPSWLAEYRLPRASLAA